MPRIRTGPPAAGIERLEAYFPGPAFAPHRHDTYGIGLTLAGVQTFGYRGTRRYGLPGQCHILHPDELHDGAAGTEAGFGYRIVYLDPAQLQDALGGRRLPFVADPVVDAAALPPGLAPALWEGLADPLDEVARTDLVAMAADMLAAAAGHGTAGHRAAGRRLHLAGLRRVRALIAAHPAERHPMATLECVSGLDRWTLARQFRAAFGTSPDRFRTMRRLDHVRRLLAQGTPPAEASVEAGFADQSHMTRRFKRAYGLTPARWAAATTAAPAR